MSYILDTTIVSELRRPSRADAGVVEWVSQVQPALLFLSVVTLLELEQGMLLIERRDAVQGANLREWLTRQVLPAYEHRILSIDPDVAVQCARLHVPDRRPERDALIAATALTHGMPVVTRNVAHFEVMGVQVINPWRSTSA